MARKFVALVCLLALAASLGALPASAKTAPTRGPQKSEPLLPGTGSTVTPDLTEKLAERSEPNEASTSGPVRIAEATAASTTAPVYRIYDTAADSVIYTTDLSGFADNDLFHYDGIGFYCKPATDSINVYRLTHVATGKYRYAQGENDKDYLLTTYPGQFVNEGVAFTRDSSWMADESPIWWFTRGSEGEDFYTADPDEKTFLQYDNHGYSYQGILFYSPTRAADGTGSIAGTVTASEGPITGLRVYATGASGTWSGVTGADGSYTIYGLPAGDYQVSFSTWPYAGEWDWDLAPEFYNDAHTRTASSLVMVTAGTTTSNIDATLDPTAPLGDPTGNLVPVYRLSDKYNGAVFLTDDWDEVLAYLDQLGAYYHYDGAAFFYDEDVDTTDVHRFYNKQTDTYYYTPSAAEAQQIITYYSYLFDYEGVCFKSGPPLAAAIRVHRFYRPEYSDIILSASEEEVAALRGEMGASMSYEGTAFHVNGGLRIGTGTGSISGTVTGPNNAPLSGLWVRAAREDDVASYGTWLGRTNSSGQYIIEGLPPGEYIVSFEIWPRSYDAGFPYQPEYYNNTHIVSGASPVSVTTANVPNINAKLEGQPRPVYRFYKPSTGTHFYTADPEECANVIENLYDVYDYEGVCYSVNPFNPSNSLPLHRFYNKRTGTHLYTADDGEKQYIMNVLWETYSHDGVSYYVSGSSGLQVHRFYAPAKGVHFFSADPDEIAYVRANLGGTWRYEGPSYMVGQ